jgi:hypothetical protein
MAIARQALMLACRCLWIGSGSALAAATGMPASADLAVSSRVLEHVVEGDFAENLVRITVMNHGPADVSSYLVATCLTEPPPLEIDAGVPGGCGEFTHVAPCTEFGLGFRFGVLARGQAFQCLARVRSPLHWSSFGLSLSASHARDANGNGMLDPNEANDAIVLSAGGMPDFTPVPGVSTASLLALAGLVLTLVYRHLAGRRRAA